MNGTYEAWIEQEKQWANEMKLQHIRSMKKTLILTPPICILVLGIIGILVGDVKQMLFNAIVGLAFGVVVDLLCLLIMLPTNPGKRYIKTLRKTVEKQITDDTRRGEFAAQMLGMGGEGTVKTVVWTNSSKQKEKWSSQRTMR